MANEDIEERMERRRQQIQLRMKSCDARDPVQCRSLTLDAAKEAYETFMPERFGYFRGGGLSIVFSNMGLPNQWVREAFRDKLDSHQVSELAVATWPRTVEADGRYTWAVMIKDPNGEFWREVAAQCWVKCER